MTNPPLVSIIMPAHNAGAYIMSAVESVLAQTCPDWELVIVDDASTDNTAEVIGRYLADTRITWHPVARIGHPAGVRNVALHMARGEFIAFLDADDEYFPDTLERLSRPLLEDPSLSAVYGFGFNMDENGNPLPQTLDPQLPGYSHSWKNIVTGNISCQLPGLMLRRSAREAIGFFNENLCGPEDYEFYVRLFLHDYAGIYCLGDYAYRYRIHKASLTKAPEHYERLLTSDQIIVDWLFNEAPIPHEIRPLKSQAYVSSYRYFARERLLYGQPRLARTIAWRARRNPNIRQADFINQCLPIILRSFLPGAIDQRLVGLRRRLRRLKAGIVSGYQWRTSS